jgi:hypothetical protein
MERRLFLLPWMACMPEMQEQFPAGASMATIPKSETWRM